MTAGKAGAIEVIMKAMSLHMDNAGVCEYGCVALKNITLNGRQTTNKIK